MFDFNIWIFFYIFISNYVGNYLQADMKKFSFSLNRVQKADKFGQIEEDAFSVGFGIIDMAAQTSDYKVSSTGVAADFMPEYMYIIPETAGSIVVELVGQTEGVTYTVSAAQVTAFAGKPLPYKVRKVVKSGTTATFSVVW